MFLEQWRRQIGWWMMSEWSCDGFLLLNAQAFAFRLIVNVCLGLEGDAVRPSGIPDPV